MKHTGMRNLLPALGLVLGLLACLPGRINAQAPEGDPAVVGASFTYQGDLAGYGSPVEGIYDFEFKLYDTLTGGNQVGSSVTKDNIPVRQGSFTVELDFGSVFTGSVRYLEIGLRPGNQLGAYTPLALRQKLAVVPYALALPGLWTESNPTSPNLVGGYSGNRVNRGAFGATIAGGGASGNPNRATDNYGTVSGGDNNQAGDDAGSTSDSAYATVSGGFSNRAGNAYAAVGGGWLNTASHPYTTIGGGSLNIAGNLHATVSGGLDNTASGVATAIGGGWLNRAGDAYATVGGGYSNQAGNVYTTIGGGSYNTASGSRATIGGGYGNTAGGAFATVPGGKDNLAQGDYSFAAGRQAQANAPGCFVWADATKADLICAEPNRFIIRASGGISLSTSSDLNAGALLPAGSGSWAALSDRQAKANLKPVDGRDILARLSDLPIQTWNYKAQDPSIRHIGPLAQDFYTAFSVGEDDRYISMVDAAGVTLAAVQELHRLAQEQAAQIAAQQEQIAALRQQNANLEARLAALEALVKK